MDWTEIIVTAPVEQIDAVGAICSMTVPYGIYIEDYSDLEQGAMEIAHIDLIEESLLAKDRSKGLVHVYISPQENPAEAVSFIRERLDVLDKVIASRISSDEKLSDSAEEELDVMMADREAFLRSTKILFEENHPKFTAYLAEKGLTDWEIGYCCLYTLGLKGKDIGEYIQKKRHYIISHEIRQKLGLDEHDTNISIYLRELLLQTER